MLAKQAKILSDLQIKAVLGALSSGRNACRNRVMFLLTLHGLRACEVASLELRMVLDGEGNVGDAIHLENKATKGKCGGRVVFMNQALREELKEYLIVRDRKESVYLITTERRDRFSANAVAVWFKRFYSKLGFIGASSHSGRRTFGTRAAKKVSQAGGSLRDVQALLGHANLQQTQKYLDQDSDAQRRVVEMIIAH